MNRTRDSPDAATTSACVNESDSTSVAKFEVFLSFRGPDMRLDFTDFLYHTLVGAGIQVFRDDEEIQKGEEIGGELLDAIKSSKIYVPIFSKNYASSALRLRELTHMVKCEREATDKVILPIFYDVKPDDVKLKTLLYLNALEKHEEKFGHDDVRQWKEALTEVAAIKGWDLQEKGQSEIIDIIFHKVLTKLMIRRRILPDHLVGIHDHVKAFMNFHDVGCLVIHGMGGIGKTTLASAVFNQIYNQFHGYSFLLNVRESAQHGRIMDLQNQILSELGLGKSPEICHSVNEGINMIRKRFCNKKVLLILDGVNSWDQLSVLAGRNDWLRNDWFGLGCEIIITTRDISFLPIEEENKETSSQAHSEEFEFYEMTEMDSFHALRLFIKHAFRMDFPPQDFDDISCKFISKIGRHPLAQVIDFSLSCKREKLWNDTLKKLEFVPNPRVNQRLFDKLRISYDDLEHHQQEIFLDIACFFIGRERLHPYYMWKASSYFPKSGLRHLTERSLMKIVENDTLWMHDLLGDMGREIVRREDVNFPGKRSRLWEPEIAFDIVWKNEGTDRVVALRLTGLSQEYSFTSEEFSKMPNLRFLELEGGNLVGDFKNLLSKLTWLSWSNCPSELNAMNLCLEKLVVLELSGSHITEDWVGWGLYLVSKDLKVIQITQCPNLRRTPDVSKCSKLKRLVLQGGKTSLVVNGSLSKLAVYGF